MALKNYKRQGRRSQTIVVSLVISMVAFIAMFSFGQNTMSLINEADQLYSYDISIYISHGSQDISELNQFLNQNDKVESYYYQLQLGSSLSQINKEYLNFDVDQSVIWSEDEYYGTEIIGLREEDMKKICQLNNIEYQKNIVFALNNEINAEDTIIKKRFKKMDAHFIKSMYLTDTDENGEMRKSKLKDFDNVVMIDDIGDYDIFQSSNFTFVVPIDYVLNVETPYQKTFEYHVNSDQHKELTEELETAGFSSYDYAESVSTNRQIFFIIQIFIYGFVCIMIFFTILNIINMMSASIEKRKKEFAMMLSVGMSLKGIQQMIWRESLIYGLKTFLYAAPLSLGVEKILYDQTKIQGSQFTISYMAYLISFLVIMLVMVITFRVGLKTFRKQNIIETLKDDM